MDYWFEAVDVLAPHVFQISTPQGTGTGFLLWRSKDDALCAFATAAHVVQHANHWDLPVRIATADREHQILLHPTQRAIVPDFNRDTAVVVAEIANLGALPIPESPLELIEPEYHLRVGNTIGWLGFPAIPSASLCYFRGAVSAWLEDQKSYFVDGVAINGVSGGPAFDKTGDGPYIIGVVSAYMPNRVYGETLPGLAIVRDVSHFHEVVADFRSLEEAREKAATVPSEPPPVPPTPPPESSIQSGSNRAT